MRRRLDARPLGSTGAGGNGTDRARRNRTIIRSVMLFAILVMVFGAVAPVLAQESRPYTTTTPASPEARTIQDLYKLIFWMGVVVFIFIQFLIIYTSMRFKRRRTHQSRPAQVHGHRTLEITWTIIPAIILLIIAVPTITTIYDTYAAGDDTENAMIVDVYGKQWWWEIHYPGMGPIGEDGQPTDLITANEIRIPEGQNVVFRLYSNNVIHSFWIPEMAGKMDVIPGHERRVSITPETSGTYYGECAEFCGAAHAWMRFVVKVQPRAEFDTWTTAMNAGPDTPSAAFAPDGDLSQAPSEFGACLLCHNISGLQTQGAQVGIATDPTSVNAGPNLSLLACRDTLAAGLLENTPENLALWLLNPGEVKEGNYMHGVSAGIKNQDEIEQYPNQVLSEEDVTAIVNYLESLRPAAGCPEAGVANGNMNTGANAVNAPVLATPEAGTPAPTGGGEDVTGAGSPEAGAGTPATEGEPIAPAGPPAAESAGTPATESGATPAAAPVATPVAGADAPASGPVQLEGGDIYYNLDEITIAQGQTMELVNVGNLEHNFAIEGYNDDTPGRYANRWGGRDLDRTGRSRAGVLHLLLHGAGSPGRRYGGHDHDHCGIATGI